MKRKHMLVRVFLANTDPIAKAKRSSELRELCERVLQLEDNGQPFVEVIHILWVNDPRYHPKQRDCGIGEGVFRDAVAGLPRIEFHTPLGGSFCGVLNYGLGVCRERGADFVWICSPESSPAIDQDLANEVSRRIARGDRVIGVAVNEEAVELTKKGAVANACSLYDLRAIQDTAGGFHPIADAPRDDFPSMLVGAKDGSTLCMAGVEEILVLVPLVARYGKCISVIVPKTFYRPPVDTEGRERHDRKMHSKEIRMARWYLLLGVAPGYLLRGFVEDEYPMRNAHA